MPCEKGGMRGENTLRSLNKFILGLHFLSLCLFISINVHFMKHYILHISKGECESYAQYSKMVFTLGWQIKLI